MDRKLSNALARATAFATAARTWWEAFIADPREKHASIALASLLAATALVWGVSSIDRPRHEPATVVALNPAPLAEAPAAQPVSPPPVLQPAATEPPAPQAAAQPLPAPPQPIAKAEPAKTAPKTAGAVKPATKETKMAKATEPKAAMPPPASPEELLSTGALPSAKTPLDSQAQNYMAFASDIDKLAKMDFKTPKDVRAAYDQLLKHQPEKLSDGWIAYSARIVANNDEFAKAIDAEVQKRGRDGVMAKITSDPKYVNKLPGAYDALDGLMKQVARDTTKLSALGDRFIQTAYAFQKKKWGEADSLPRPHYTAAETARVMPAGFFSRDKEEPAAPVGVTQRILLLAASLDAGGPDAAASKDFMHDPGLSQCMRWARLNLNQCLAAAYFPSEQAYCTGKHGIAEVNACWTKLLPTKS